MKQEAERQEALRKEKENRKKERERKKLELANEPLKKRVKIEKEYPKILNPREPSPKPVEHPKIITPEVQTAKSSNTPTPPLKINSLKIKIGNKVLPTPPVQNGSSQNIKTAHIIGRTPSPAISIASSDGSQKSKKSKKDKKKKKDKHRSPSGTPSEMLKNGVSTEKKS